MWQRLLRLLGTSLNLYNFYANPARFILSLLTVIVIPYLAYIFWGTLIIFALTILGIYLLYKIIKEAQKGGAYS